MADIVTFGEIMLRLATPGFYRFAHAPHLELTYAGGEANAAVAIAALGGSAEFVTKLPNNDIADRCLRELRGLGVGTGHVVRGGERMGIYFLETGASQRASKVTYDRAHSAIAGIRPGEIDWDAVFRGARWFHWTGITPALSESAAAVVEEACQAARRAGLTVSTDLNYRSKLWSRDRARAVMSGLMPHVDLCVANEEDAESVFGIKGSEVTAGKIERDRYEDVARQLAERFGCQRVAITLRESLSASVNGWSGMLFADGHAHFSQRYEITIVDRLGGGDSFAGALIFALLRDDDPPRAIELAAAASCLAQTIPGDYLRVSLGEVEALARGSGSGRVQR